MKKVKRQKNKTENKTVNKIKAGEVILLLALIIILLSINYPFLDKKVENFLTEGKTATVHVQRVIDGDTIVTNGSEHIRLLGINTPERSEFLYQEAKNFLESQVLNKTISLEFVKNKYDKYNRTLAYIFIDGKNVNEKIVENGFANYYFYDGLDKYSADLKDAWKICVENNKNLCEKSTNVCGVCMAIKDSSTIINSCSFSCNITGWQIKGEGREKFIFNQQTSNPGQETKFALDLTNSGGSLFLRDEEGKLVDWE